MNMNLKCYQQRVPANGSPRRVRGWLRTAAFCGSGRAGGTAYHVHTNPRSLGSVLGRPNTGSPSTASGRRTSSDLLHAKLPLSSLCYQLRVGPHCTPSPHTASGLVDQLYRLLADRDPQATPPSKAQTRHNHTQHTRTRPNMHINVGTQPRTRAFAHAHACSHAHVFK